MAKNSKNYTFSLPVELMNKVKTYSEVHESPSINGMVREAVEQYLIKLDKALLGLQMQKAASDPIFIEDLNACINDFEIADCEVMPEPKRK